MFGLFAGEGGGGLKLAVFRGSLCSNKKKRKSDV